MLVLWLYQSYSRVLLPGRPDHTHPVDHGVLVRGQRGQGVGVVGLTEQLQHRLGARLLARAAHRARAGLGAEIIFNIK